MAKNPVEKMSWEELIEKFGTANYEEKRSMVYTYLNRSDVSSDVVFDMISGLWIETRKNGNYETFAALVERVQTQHPELYKEDAPFYSMYLIESMALQGEFKNLPRVLEPFVQDPMAIDEFIRVIELLMYHSHTGPLIKAMQAAYPGIMRSEEILPPGKDEFAYFLGMFLIFEGLENGTEWNELQQEVSRYWKPDPAYLTDLVARLRGEVSESWQREEFLKGSGKKRKVEEKFLKFAVGYMHWLVTERAMSFSRAMLARDALVEYLLGREHYPQVKKGKPLLLPLKTPLDRHLGTYLNPLNNLPYPVASLIEALPYYYEYLLHHGLIEEPELMKQLKIMKSLKETVVTYYRRLGMELALPAIEAAWSEY